MVHDVIVMQRVSSSVGEHRIEQFNFFSVRRRKAGGRRSIPFDHDGMYPTVRAVTHKTDRIGSERIDPFTSVLELAVPSKHPPCANQLGMILHCVPPAA